MERPHSALQKQDWAFAEARAGRPDVCIYLRSTLPQDGHGRLLVKKNRRIKSLKQNESGFRVRDTLRIIRGARVGDFVSLRI